MHLTRETIITSAMAILDAYGLPDLSMRRIATNLGVQPSALYWHFESKQALLAGMAEVILADLPDFPHGDLSRLPAWAARFHGLLMRHPSGAELVWSVLSLHNWPSDLGSQIEEGLEATGVPPDVVQGAAQGLLHLILGQAFEEDQRTQAQRLGVIKESPSKSAKNLDDAIAVYVAGIQASC